MDLGLYMRVLWRFRLIVAAGFVLACFLGVLTIAKIDFGSGVPKLTLRQKPVYQSQATLLMTQAGFPWGSAVQKYAPSGLNQPPTPVGDPARLTALSNVYVAIANSDAVRLRTMRATKARGTITANASFAPTPSGYATQLPMMTLSGTGETPSGAIAVTTAGVQAFQSYIKRQQKEAGIGPQRRVIVQTLRGATESIAIGGPKKTMPLVVFLTVMMAVVGLAFVLENLRPRVHLSVAQAEPPATSTRRTA